MEETKIKDLKPNQKNVFIKDLEVIETSEIYKIEKLNKEVCDGRVRDKEGNEIGISVFEDNDKHIRIKHFKEAKRITLEYFYVKEYNGELRLSSGFYGRVKKLE